MSWEQRNADFCKAQTDAQMTYIEAEREVDRLQTENDRLRELVARMAHVLKVDDEWQDPFYCNPYCADQFNCRGDDDDCVEVECPIVKNMRELGVEVDA